MLYISSNPQPNIFGITDTADGVEEFYSTRDILTTLKVLNIKGVSGNTIQVVNASTDVVQKSFDLFGDIVKRKIYSYDYETCENLARKAGFVRKLKAVAGDSNAYHQLTYEHLYPNSIKEVVASASQYSNNVKEVDCSNAFAIKSALRSGVCLVLQHGAKGALTAFICTANLSIVDSIYGVGFFDGIYLTKVLTDMTTDVSRVNPKRQNLTPKNPDLLPVFSCSLRFRDERIKTDTPLKELSSPFYSVNIPNVLGMFILDNPKALGDLILPEFQQAANKNNYKFNFKLYNEVLTCLENASCDFGQPEKMQWYCNGVFKDGVNVDELCIRFTASFDYMEYLRGNGFSFK